MTTDRRSIISARLISHVRRKAPTVAVLVLALISLVSVPAFAQQATPSPTAFPGLRITAADSSCDVDGQINPEEAPFVRVRFVNEGQDPHQAQIVQLQPGASAEDVTAAEVQAAIASEVGTDATIQTFVGGPGAILTGGLEDVILELPSGSDQAREYVALCSVPGQTDAATVVPLEIPEPTGSARAPQAAVTVTLTDGAIEMPTTIAGGRRLWAITNEGTRPHDLVLVRLSTTVTQQTVLTHIEQNAGELPKNVAAGGMRVLSPGTTGWLQFELPPGQYLALCDIDQTAQVFVVTS